MCGVPFHAADIYITKLVDNGHKVAICEQVEDPKLAKGLVKREVIRVVTPGTNTDAAALDAWFDAHPNHACFVFEEFITGLLVSYDAIYNAEMKPVFENNTVFPTPIMDIVHGNLDTCYWTNKTVPAALAAIGRRTVEAFGIRSRFVHLEFFQLDRDRAGLGSKGDYVGLEVNMRPPGG